VKLARQLGDGLWVPGVHAGYRTEDRIPLRSTSPSNTPSLTLLSGLNNGIFTPLSTRLAGAIGLDPPRQSSLLPPGSRNVGGGPAARRQARGGWR
jgi:hypothetical protein